MGKGILGFLQKIGKALMLPIATLPVAALLLRLGQSDVFEAIGLGNYVQYGNVIAQAGDALFANLALIFAIGVAIGLSDDGNGAAGLAGAVGYLVLTNASKALWIARLGEKAAEGLKYDAFGGIIAGIVAGYCYNKFKNVKLPEFLGFFGGRRLVPIMTSLFVLLISVLGGFIWPQVQNAINTFGISIVGLGAIGAGIFGFFNRLLIPMGLHHVLNTYFWFTLGEYNGAAGDIKRFFAGDPTAGTYQAGFYPVMMFGLPAVALAIYFAAKKEKRKAVAGMLASLAFTSFLTGITEPIEFLFIFLSPVLLVVHAAITGISMAVTSMLGVLHGFGFSAGFIDYALNYGLPNAKNPILIIPIGLVVAAVYFIVFYFVITKLNIPTPGRENDEEEFETSTSVSGDMATLAKEYVQALGGATNIKSVDNCVTRLRLEVKDNTLLKDAKLRALGAKGVVRVSKTAVQVIVGTNVQFVSDALKKELNK
ncbi:MAG: N-acetylglucosamine-specific PTS transporter subunit IIBC [Sarcina sp.]